MYEHACAECYCPSDMVQSIGSCVFLLLTEQRDDLGNFTLAPMMASVHLGQNYQENLRATKNTDFEKAKQLFEISQKLILNQNEEMRGISTINLDRHKERFENRPEDIRVSNAGDDTGFIEKYFFVGNIL